MRRIVLLTVGGFGLACGGLGGAHPSPSDYGVDLAMGVDELFEVTGYPTNTNIATREREAGMLELMNLRYSKDDRRFFAVSTWSRDWEIERSRGNPVRRTVCSLYFWLDKDGICHGNGYEVKQNHDGQGYSDTFLYHDICMVPSVAKLRVYLAPLELHEADVFETTAATFRATYRIEAYSDLPLVRVPLLPLSVAVSGARIDGRPAPIDIENGKYTLLTDKKGPFELTIDFAVDVQTTSGQSGFAFEMPSAGATQVSLVVPDDEDLSFEVANARLQNVITRGGERVVEASLPSSGSLALTWQRAQSDTAVEDEPRIYAEVYTLVGIGDGLLQATSTINHTIVIGV